MWTGDRRQIDQIAVEPPDRATVCAEEPDRAPADGLEDPREIGWGARNDLQDVARRRLLLEGLSEILVARLQLVQEPRVLDGDDRLVGEGLEQRDLRAREGPR